MSTLNEVFKKALNDLFKEIVKEGYLEPKEVPEDKSSETNTYSVSALSPEAPKAKVVYPGFIKDVDGTLVGWGDEILYAGSHELIRGKVKSIDKTVYDFIFLTMVDANGNEYMLGEGDSFTKFGGRK